MTMQSIPVTDAFNENDVMSSLEVELTPSQIEWLEQAAEQQDVSIGHVIRMLLTARMREADPSSSLDRGNETTTGDGVPPDFADEVVEAGASEESSTEASSDDNLLDRLRSTHEQFKELAGEKGNDDANQTDEGRQIQQDVERTAQDEQRDGGIVEKSMAAPSDPTSESEEERSMFDMVE